MKMVQRGYLVENNCFYVHWRKSWWLENNCKNFNGGTISWNEIVNAVLSILAWKIEMKSSVRSAWAQAQAQAEEEEESEDGSDPPAPLAPVVSAPVTGRGGKFGKSQKRGASSDLSGSAAKK